MERYLVQFLFMKNTCKLLSVDLIYYPNALDTVVVTNVRGVLLPDCDPRHQLSIDD